MQQQQISETNMDNPSAPSKQLSESRSTKELVTNGEEPPERYFYKNCDEGFLDPSLPAMEIPVIDLGLLKSPEELEKLRSALISFGCIEAINHGMTSTFLDEVREVVKQFFQLPEAEKQKYAREVNSIEGYGNDMILLDSQILDWNDRLYLKISPEDQRQLRFWPQNPESLRDILHEYTLKLKMINEVVLKAMARSLNLEDNSFLSQFGEEANMFARFNFYPPCPKPDVVLGLKPHADGSGITMVLQDKEVEGLQFLKDSKWFRAPIVPEALLINIGDQVEIMSNGFFKSPMHRAVISKEKQRISLAVFSAPGPDQEIEPLDELVSQTRPKSYKKLKDYPAIYFHYYQQAHLFWWHYKSPDRVEDPSRPWPIILWLSGGPVS
ncbi:protein SRG1-like isoform X2 [Tripterygium wilfordii]|uniref:protein SRG1-like isoform X2 n=1 Tax=Tripterygium wilfordii TaxID=458696 RepID=UPI0018F84F75|nr:protein SRG1-like isoform X2 [Tripterygium wilfordii]